MPDSSTILNTLGKLTSPTMGNGADTTFVLGFLSALGAKELEDQAASQKREATKASKSAMPSGGQLQQGTLGQDDILALLARFSGAGMMQQPSPVSMLAAQLGSPQAPSPVGPAMVGPPAGPLGSPVPGAPLLPPGIGGPSPVGLPLMAGAGPPIGSPLGGMNPLIMAALRARMQAAGGLV